MATESYTPESKTISFETLETLHSQRVESTYLIDLRRHPRFDTDIPGTATAVSGESVSVRITNMSRSGMRLVGSQQDVGILIGDPLLVSDFLQISFSVPNDLDHLVPVRVRCRTVYTRCEAGEACQIGLECVVFDDGGDAFNEYVSYREAMP